jgi:peptide/nickel transport system permease protein
MSTVELTAQLGRARTHRSAWRRWRGLPGSLRLGLTILVACVLFGLVGSFALGDPNGQELTVALHAPGSPGHLLGTDSLGRDVLTWIAASVRTSLLIGAAVVLISAIVGAVVGTVAGYVGGALDAVLMRLVDLQLAIPPLLLFLAASAAFTPGIVGLIVLMSAIGWVPYARVVRTQVQVERTRASVAAARLAGATRRRIVLVHLLPSGFTLMLVLASLHFGFVLLGEAALSFVGLGVQPPHASLGYLISQGRIDLQSAWWVVVCPGAMLGLLLLAANLIGDGLQEAFDVELEVLDK